MPAAAKNPFFNLANDDEEKNNLADQDPDIAQCLESSSNTWPAQLTPAGLPSGKILAAME